MLVGLHKGKSWLSRLIRWQTRSQYSHASAVLLGLDPVTIEAVEGIGVHKLGFRGFQPDVDYFLAPLTEEQERAAVEFLEEQIGKPYDWSMVARFISRRQEARKTSGKWFCSELVFAAIKKAGVALLSGCEPWEVSPGLLAKSPLLQPYRFATAT